MRSAMRELKMTKPRKILRSIIEIIVVLLILASLFYFSLVIKIFVAEHKIIFNVFEYEGVNVYILIALIAILVILFKDLVNFLRKISDKLKGRG
jgi:hypothetical protein